MIPTTAAGHTLDLIARGGEVKTVPVIDTSPTRFAIRWGIAGLYEIALRDGLLIGARGWRIKDLDAARALHRRLRDVSHAETRASIEKYMQEAKGKVG